jgi:hypothetical protein
VVVHMNNNRNNNSISNENLLIDCYICSYRNNSSITSDNSPYVNQFGFTGKDCRSGRIFVVN